MGSSGIEVVYLSSEGYANPNKRIREKEMKPEVDQGVISKVVLPRHGSPPPEDSQSLIEDTSLKNALSLYFMGADISFDSFDRGVVGQEMHKEKAARAKSAAKSSPRTLGWHFMQAPPKGGLPRTRFSREIIDVGKVLQAAKESPLELCENGMHASETALDAIVNMSLEYSAWVARVEVWSNVGEGLGWESSKFCGRYRKVLWMVDADKVLLEFAIDMTKLFKRDETEINGLYDKLLQGAIMEVSGKPGGTGVYRDRAINLAINLAINRYHRIDGLLPQRHPEYYLVEAAQYLLNEYPYEAAAGIYRLLLKQHREFRNSSEESEEFEALISKCRARLDAALMALAPKEEVAE